MAYCKKEVYMMERIQRRAIKIIPILRHLSYEMRLKDCGLTPLNNRRLRRDQVEVSIALNGYEYISRTFHPINHVIIRYCLRTLKGYIHLVKCHILVMCHNCKQVLSSLHVMCINISNL